MKKLVIITIFFISAISTSQITGQWKYKEKDTMYILKIEEYNNSFNGTIIKTIDDYNINYVNEEFMIDFKRISTNTYKGKFRLKKNKKYRGRIIQIDENTLEFQYKWILFYIKDTWTRIE